MGKLYPTVAAEVVVEMRESSFVSCFRDGLDGVRGSDSGGESRGGIFFENPLDYFFEAPLFAEGFVTRNIVVNTLAELKLVLGVAF